MKQNKFFSVEMLFVVIFLALALIGCSRTEIGYVVGEVVSVERSVAGGYGVYVFHDDQTVYCTEDAELGERASEIGLSADDEVVIWYYEARWYEDTEGETIGFDECGTYGSDFNPVIIVDLYRKSEASEHSNRVLGD